MAACLVSAVAKCFSQGCKPCATRLYFSTRSSNWRQQTKCVNSALRSQSRYLHSTSTSATLWDQYILLKQRVEGTLDFYSCDKLITHLLLISKFQIRNVKLLTTAAQLYQQVNHIGSTVGRFKLNIFNQIFNVFQRKTI